MTQSSSSVGCCPVNIPGESLNGSRLERAFNFNPLLGFLMLLKRCCDSSPPDNE